MPRRIPHWSRCSRRASVPCTPSITAVGTTPERITHLVEVAHRQCYIANSLATPVRIEPTITIAAELMGAPAAGSSGSP